MLIPYVMKKKEEKSKFKSIISFSILRILQRNRRVKFNTRATYSLEIAYRNFYYPVESRQDIDPGFGGILIMILPLSARHNHVIYLSCVKQWDYQLVENRSHVF